MFESVCLYLMIDFIRILCLRPMSHASPTTPHLEIRPKIIPFQRKKGLIESPMIHMPP